MDERFLQNDYSEVDFSFVYELDEEGLNIFFDITDIAIESTLELIRDGGEQYIASLTPEQALEIVKYYYLLLEVYTDYEQYEECNDLLEIIDSIENYFQIKKSEEEVGNLNKKH